MARSGSSAVASARNGTGLYSDIGPPGLPLLLFPLLTILAGCKDLVLFRYYVGVALESSAPQAFYGRSWITV